MRGRFAPSPTGYMHLGNVWVALLAYIRTRRSDSTFVLRMEDIDVGRSKREYEDAIMQDLDWLGITWDEGPDVGGSKWPYRQSERRDIYESILKRWKEEDLIYPCYCNRSRIQSISAAPHRGEAKAMYDGYCRNISKKEWLGMQKKPSFRFRMQEACVTFEDVYQGFQEMHVHPCEDDFVLARGDGMISYQLAVSVDDMQMGIEEVIRGEDLLAVTPWQIVLHQHLGGMIPRYGHVPLLVDAKGDRLSKRQRGITVKELRETGVTAEEIVAFLLKENRMIGENYRKISIREAIEIINENVIQKKRTHILTKIDI